VEPKQPTTGGEFDRLSLRHRGAGRFDASELGLLGDERQGQAKPEGERVRESAREGGGVGGPDAEVEGEGRTHG
jgi:hypothetical protein